MNLPEIFAERLNDTQALVEKTNKSSVLIIQQFPRAEDTDVLVPNVRESISNILAFVELGSIDHLEHILQVSDGFFDFIIVDCDMKCTFSKSFLDHVKSKIKKSKIFYYSDNATWAYSAIDYIQNIEQSISSKSILVSGHNHLANKLTLMLYERNANVYWHKSGLSNDYLKNIDSLLACKPLGKIELVDNDFDFSKIDFVVGAEIKRVSIELNIAQQVKKSVRFYDIGIGNFSSDVIAAVEEKGCTIYRLDNRAGISSMVVGLLETNFLTNKMMGRVFLKDVELVAGGVMGHSGAIIVDNVYDPSYVIGVADGKGRVKLGPETEKEKRDFKLITKLVSKV